MDYFIQVLQVPRALEEEKTGLPWLGIWRDGIGNMSVAICSGNNVKNGWLDVWWMVVDGRQWIVVVLSESVGATCTNGWSYYV